MNLNITFKNVYQGDTILLDWLEEKSEVRKFALIDCNVVDGGIKYLTEHIQARSIREFEFVIMSHPHSDHYSGFPELFLYCENNNIIIKRFIHTACFDPKYLETFGLKTKSVKDYIRDVVFDDYNFDKLFYIYCKLHDQVNIGKSDRFIKQVDLINREEIINLVGGLELKILAPITEFEIREYVRRSMTIRRKGRNGVTIESKQENNPNANFFSTLIQLQCTGLGNDWQILLCSDSTKYTLSRLLKQESDDSALWSKRLLAAQIPHHGSFSNHSSRFWQKIKELKNSHIIISAGMGYGHPNIKTIDFFHENSQYVHSTNYVGGYFQYYERRNGNVMSKEEGYLSLFDAIYSNVRMFNSCGEKRISVIPGDGEFCCKIKTGKSLD